MHINPFGIGFQVCIEFSIEIRTRCKGAIFTLQTVAGERFILLVVVTRLGELQRECVEVVVVIDIERLPGKRYRGGTGDTLQFHDGSTE